MKSLILPEKPRLFAPMLSTFGGGSVRGFRAPSGGGAGAFDTSALSSYAAYHSSGEANNSASGLQSYMTNKGVSRADFSATNGATISNSYLNSSDTVYLVSNNNSLTNEETFDFFPNSNSSTKVVLMCFAANVYSSSDYSLDINSFRNSNRFYTDLNDGDDQTGNNFKTFNFNVTSNPVTDNLSNTNSFTAYAYYNHRSNQNRLPVFNSSVGSGYNVEAYEFMKCTDGGSGAMGVKNLDTGGGVVSIPIFFDSIGGGYSGNFSSTAQTQMYDLIYCSMVWLCS